MGRKDYHKSITTNIPASEAIEKISNVGEWWLSSFKGKAEKVNDVFTMKVGDHGTVGFKIIEVVPNKKIVWLVTDCYLSWYKDKAEWRDTTVVFEISEQKGKTKIDFTHVGLTPKMECYDDCEWGWNNYIGESLKSFFDTGKGIPYEGPY